MSASPAARRLVAPLVSLLLLLAACSGDGRRYEADRFDVHMRLQPDGTVRVTERVVFRFEGGAFTRVARELPLGGTDGIEVVSAAMDGASLPRDEDAERYLDVSRENKRVRVRWRFPSIQGSHSFSLTYLVRGLVEENDEEDVIEWAALPRDHDYRIDSSVVTLEWPESARVRAVSADGEPLETEGQTATLRVRDLGEDEHVTLRAAFAPATAAPRPAGWEGRAARRREMIPVWAILAGALFLASSGLLWLRWLKSPRPAGREVSGDGPLSHPPDDMPPAMVGALVSAGGGPSGLHTIASVLELARRGLLEIDERPPRGWSGRKFVVRRAGPRTGEIHLRPHEQKVLESVFSHKGRTDDEVEMGRIRSRLAAASTAVTDAVRRELREAHLLDPDRLQARRRMMILSGVVLAAGLVSAVPPIPFADDFGPWPFLLPLALILSSLFGFVLASSLPVQTDEGLRRANLWKRYGKHLQRAARKGEETLPLAADTLPHAMALGAAAKYAAALKRRGAPVPGWFHAASSASGQESAAFVALIVAASASSGSAGAGAGGGAAGGGSSGAS